MQIATSTILYKNYNYGGCLQAFALQQAIHNLGYESEVIKFQRITPSNANSLNRHSLHKYIKSPYVVAKKIVKFLLYKIYFEKYFKAFYSGFEVFSYKFIKSSETLYSEQNEEEIGNIYDKIIVGSDQVWHGDNLKNKSHTLDFIYSKPLKFSYAASLGDSEISDDSVTYVKKIADFDRITVRETSGVDIIKKYTGKDAEVVLDPTFLIDKAKWTNLAEQSDYPLPKCYVFVYAINDSKRKILSFAKQFAKDIGAKIIIITRGLLMKDLVIYSRTQGGVNPADWVKLLLNADYVVTDSFHGTAFSINLEKQFYVYANSQTGRIDTILNMVGLQRRRIDGGRIDKRKIDFTEPRRKLNAERERCNGILKEMLEWDASDGQKS